MSFAPDFLKRFAQYGAETSAAAGLPPPAPANPNDIDLSFMQDHAVMVEELTAAKREASAASSMAGMPTWAGALRSCNSCQ
jgi:hypothetical protein